MQFVKWVVWRKWITEIQWNHRFITSKKYYARKRDWLTEMYFQKQDDFSKVIEQNKDLNNTYETLMALCEKERILWGVKSDIPVIRKIGFGTWIIL